MINNFNSKDFIQEMSNLEAMYNHYKKLFGDDREVKSMLTPNFVKLLQINLSMDNKIKGTLAMKLMTKYPYCQNFIDEVKEAIDNLYCIKDKNMLSATSYLKKYMLRLRKELNNLLDTTYEYGQKVSLSHNQSDYDKYKEYLNKFDTRYQEFIAIVRIGGTLF